MENPNAVAETATNQHQVIIIPNAELQEIIDKHKLADADVQRLQMQFSGSFAIFQEWEGKNSNLVIERADQVNEMALAQEGAKAVAKARISFEKGCAEVKEPYLRAGQAIDAIKRYGLSKFTPLEGELKGKSETGARLAKAEKDLLIEQRKNQLREVGHSGDIPGLGEMHADTFQVFLDGAIAGAQRQKEADARLLAEQQDRERLTKLCADLLALGATFIDNGENCYVLDNQEMSGYHDGISEADAARTLAAFQQKAKDLKEWEAKGRDRREALLMVNADVEWEYLGGLSDTEWASVLEGHTNTYNEAKAAKEAEQVRKDRSSARILWLVRVGATETQWDQETGYKLDSSTVTCYKIDNLDDAEWDKVIADFQDSRKRLDDAAALEAKIKERTAERFKTLERMGANQVQCFDIPDSSYMALGNARVSNQEIRELNEDYWSSVCGEFSKEYQRLIQEEDDRKRTTAAKVKLGNDRRVELAALGEMKDADVLAALSPDEWITLRDNAARLKKLADDQALQDRIAAKQKEDAAKLQSEQDKAARQKAAAAPDKEKLEKLANTFADLAASETGISELMRLPICTSDEGKAVIEDVRRMLAKMSAHIITKTSTM